MKKTVLFILIFCLSYIVLISQTPKHFYINFSPLSLLDYTQRSFRFGLKIYPIKRISIDFDYKIGLIDDRNNYKLDNTLWQIRPGINFSLAQSDKFDFYIGFEYSYLKQFESYNNYWLGIDDRCLTFDYAESIKTKETFGLKTGAMGFCGKFFYFDFYLGFGYYRKFLKFVYIENGQIKRTDERMFLVPGFEEWMCLLAGIKIGLRF